MYTLEAKGPLEDAAMGNASFMKTLSAQFTKNSMPSVTGTGATACQGSNCLTVQMTMGQLTSSLRNVNSSEDTDLSWPVAEGNAKVMKLNRSLGQTPISLERHTLADST